ncbi:Acyl-CoA dehydrogenase%2C short-chain specific [Achromobacter xylosoxidans]|uniref:acyl-CoA dehydrogenase n=1 Tax=Alcaligenes xylosoxydans xylosoxydans TaxID=85698 RepID=UPI0006C42728|nr:acyl-CoA dehydrogenase [Achromobacter xylosoxidans]CUJ46456.1 Acyl-CoA dehydrogenase%2C short-chain specific [Achromobacter xylosoxidans]CUK14124.1 Acyl-CoA dehydrogenase%2C short-chain specific [Achromobacter xylosoxidans]
MDFNAWRRRRISEPAYRWARNAMPPLSATEREAIEAGDTWWEADLFTGNPDWRKLLDVPAAALTPDEQRFIDGPVAQLCAMLDEWDITWHRRDLPPEVWSFLKAQRFFGMIIPKRHGGLGFSPYAHSEVVRRISAYSITAGVTVMVPNSLGPGELLMQFGTQAQRDYWLPRLADGREVPCFGLTSPEAGSDAASMVDTGVVCRQVVDGRELIGVRLNWHKRYITLGPVATVLGLAFKMSDPDGILGGGPRDIGISVALVPTDAPGVEIGRRHLPAMQVFQNGPNRGRDVFVPLDALIGGVERAGHGWQMLMSALAAGRGISLPSLSAAACVMSAHATGMYARVREQFGIPVGKFEGVQEKLASLAGNAYLVEAARRLTCAALNQGVKPAVVSGIMKYHATERMRISVNDAMDVHAGRAVIDGPSNYLGALYRAVPIAITVEGANILTRNLIIFGQGAIRAHPYLMPEILALGNPDEERGMEVFHDVFWRHLRHTGMNTLRAIGRAWTGGLLAPSPVSGPTAGYYRRLGRYAAGFALLADATLARLGGGLKRRELLSARLGDILAELYLLSAVLKRWEDEGRKHDDLPLVRWCMEQGYAEIEKRMDQVLSNLPGRPLAWALRAAILPLRLARGPGDALTRECAELLLKPSPTHARLAADLQRSAGGGQGDDDPLALLTRAFAVVDTVQPIRDRLRQSGVRDWREAHRHGAITATQAAQLEEAEAIVSRVLQVDDFAPEELAPGQEPSSAPVPKDDQSS